MALKRIMINLDEDLVAKVDAYADKLHINRTAAVSVLLSQACEQAEFLTQFPVLLQAYQDSMQKGEREEEK